MVVAFRFLAGLCFSVKLSTDHFLPSTGQKRVTKDRTASKVQKMELLTDHMRDTFVTALDKKRAAKCQSASRRPENEIVKPHMKVTFCLPPEKNYQLGSRVHWRGQNCQPIDMQAPNDKRRATKEQSAGKGRVDETVIRNTYQGNFCHPTKVGLKELQRSGSWIEIAPSTDKRFIVSHQKKVSMSLSLKVQWMNLW